MTENTFPIQLYTSPDGAINLDVHVDQDTIWLSQAQVSALFGVDRSVITKHIRNIIKSWELDDKSNVQKMHIPNSDKPVGFYNLDMIVSVGYRVNSIKATHFRIRATSVLKQHILKWYSLNQARLTQVGIAEVTQSLAVIKRVLETNELSRDESRGLVELMTTYIPSLITLNQYDTDNLPTKGKTSEQKYRLDKNEADQVLMEFYWMKLVFQRSANKLS